MLTRDEPEPETSKRAFAVAGALLVTVGLAWLALHLGTVAYKARVRSMHVRRLERLLVAKPLEGQVVAGLEEEGTRSEGTARTAVERESLAARAGAWRAEVLAKGGTAAVTRLFASGEMLYFLYFDEGGTLTGFTLVGD